MTTGQRQRGRLPRRGPRPAAGRELAEASSLDRLLPPAVVRDLAEAIQSRLEEPRAVLVVSFRLAGGRVQGATLTQDRPLGQGSEHPT